MTQKSLATARPALTKASLKRVLRAGNLAAFALGLWTLLFATHFYLLSVALCAAFPLCAVALDIRANGALDYETKRGRHPLSMAALLLLPAIGLAGRAIIDLNVIDQKLLIAEAVIAACAVVALFYRFDARVKADWRPALTIAIWAMVYSYGVLAFADQFFDLSAGSDSVAVIRDRRIHVSGNVKGSSVWREVSVDASVTLGDEPWIHVRPDRYAGLARGEPVCVHRGAGLFAVSWFEVRPCAPAPG
jgi:hypothetical protein